MQFIGCALLAFTCLVAIPASSPALLAPIRSANPNGTIPSNFALELKALIKQIPIGNIEKLVQGYLLNDPEFQAVIRAINSQQAYRVARQFNNQPEVRELKQWLSQQLAISGGSLKVLDSLELEIKIFNKYPFWSQLVNGIQGFQTELVRVYPVELIRSLLEPSSAQTSPLITQLWQRLVALRPVYERILNTPPAKNLIAEFQRLGVDVATVDATIRYQFGWSNATAAPVSSIDYNDYYY
ncbi:hypothetical protein KR009_001672 [Drosophila setifemur]|nr:hypothetical protein KR009_001672 [Drosophila setifemur]